MAVTIQYLHTGIQEFNFPTQTEMTLKISLATVEIFRCSKLYDVRLHLAGANLFSRATLSMGIMSSPFAKQVSFWTNSALQREICFQFFARKNPLKTDAMGQNVACARCALHKYVDKLKLLLDRKLLLM